MRPALARPRAGFEVQLRVQIISKIAELPCEGVVIAAASLDGGWVRGRPLKSNAAGRLPHDYLGRDATTEPRLVSLQKEPLVVPEDSTESNAWALWEAWASMGWCASLQ